MPPPIPTICQIVLYTLSEHDAELINARREASKAQAVGAHFGNHVAAGEVYPLIITRVWGDQPDSAVNGQVMLDGDDTLWVTSVTVQQDEAEPQCHFVWPARV